MKSKLLSCFIALSAVAGATIYFYSFTEWIPVLYLLSVLLFSFAAGGIVGGFSAKRKLVKGVFGGLIYALLFFFVNYLVNNVLLHETNAGLAAAIVTGVTVLSFLCLYFIASRQKKKHGVFAFILFFVCIAIAVGTMIPKFILPLYYNSVYHFITAPVVDHKPEVREVPLADDADFYVSPVGDDSWDGSVSSPFQTVERARDAVRLLDRSGRNGITVALKAGEYAVESLVFTDADSGTASCPVRYCAYGDGEVVINGGVTLPRDRFSAVSDPETLSRLSDDAKKNVLMIELFSLGISKEQYGKIYAIGGYNTASKYDGDWVGEIYCELFIDDARQTIARYPNGKEYLYTGEVVAEGQGRESASAAVKHNFDDLRNPEPDVYSMDKALSSRIASWKTTDDVWMFGYWRYDWADASSPLGKVDHEKLTISPKFVSTYGAKKDAPYYFFNVLEELDAPGEWFLDREKGVLYFYPPAGFTDASTVALSLSTGNVVKADADYLIFDGLTIKGTRGDAVNITGKGNTVQNCLIKNVAGYALIMDGYQNLACNNEITHTGKGGVILNGGDREMLTPGNNRAENNLVHDWSEIFETYQPAFSLNGVGNVCCHNEMYNSPHEAITYSGNDHVIEYNLIHDVNLLTDDGGAIYSGRRWDWYGNVIRYNLIYNLGADGHQPVGIYMDDALAGQSIYGNIIINAPNIGLQLGGGQDLIVHDNIVVNAREPITFDDRGRSGLSGDESSSFYHHYKQNGSVWQLLYDSPWQTEIWQNAYPQYRRYSDDFSNPDDPDFVLNPGNGFVRHNILVSAGGTIGNISENAYKYSVIEDNAVFGLSALRKLFVDPENGNYNVREDAPIDFEIDVPSMNEFGRQ